MGLPAIEICGRDAIDEAMAQAVIVAGRAGRTALAAVGSFEIGPQPQLVDDHPFWVFPDPWPAAPSHLVDRLRQVSNELDRQGDVGTVERRAGLRRILCLASPDGTTHRIEARIGGRLARPIGDCADDTFAHYLIPDGEDATLTDLGPARQQHYNALGRALDQLRERTAS